MAIRAQLVRKRTAVFKLQVVTFFRAQRSSAVPSASKNDNTKCTFLEELCMASPIQQYLPVVTHRNQKVKYGRLRKQNKA